MRVTEQFSFYTSNIHLHDPNSKFYRDSFYFGNTGLIIHISPEQDLEIHFMPDDYTERPNSRQRVVLNYHMYMSGLDQLVYWYQYLQKMEHPILDVNNQLLVTSETEEASFRDRQRIFLSMDHFLADVSKVDLPTTFTLLEKTRFGPKTDYKYSLNLSNIIAALSLEDNQDRDTLGNYYFFTRLFKARAFVAKETNTNQTS